MTEPKIKPYYISRSDWFVFVNDEEDRHWDMFSVPEFELKDLRLPIVTIRNMHILTEKVGTHAYSPDVGLWWRSTALELNYNARGKTIKESRENLVVKIQMIAKMEMERNGTIEAMLCPAVNNIWKVAGLLKATEKNKIKLHTKAQIIQDCARRCPATMVTVNIVDIINIRRYEKYRRSQHVY